MTPSPCTGLHTAAATASTRVTDMQQQWQGPAHDRDAAHVCGHAHAHIHTHTHNRQMVPHFPTSSGRTLQSPTSVAVAGGLPGDSSRKSPSPDNPLPSPSVARSLRRLPGALQPREAEQSGDPAARCSAWTEAWDEHAHLHSRRSGPPRS